MIDWGELALEEDSAGLPKYQVQFGLGMPVDMDRVQLWTSPAFIHVHSRADITYVGWVHDSDAVTEADWMTRPARMVWIDPWAAVWEYVNWDLHRFMPMPRPPEEEEDDE